jgi:hypothetical protein
MNKMSSTDGFLHRIAIKQCARLLTAGALFILCCSCQRNATAVLEGTVRERGDIEQSYSVASPDAFDQYPLVADAIVKIVVIEKSTETIIASTKTKSDGSFYLSYPRTLPDNSYLIVSYSSGDRDYKDSLLAGPQRHHKQLGIILKKPRQQ